MSIKTNFSIICYPSTNHEYISSDTQRTVVAGILHAVQDGIQSQMVTKIEKLEESDESSVIELPADDTALYCLSDWALKSCIDNTTKLLKKKETCTQVQQQLELLLALKRPNSAKASLPLGAQYIDHG